MQAEESWEAWRDREGVNVVHIKIKAGKAKDGVVPFTPETVKQVLEVRSLPFAVPLGAEG